MSELMEDPRNDPRMEQLGGDDRVIAFDMLLRGAMAPHLGPCGHGLGGGLATAVTMNVLGAVAAQAGLKKEDIYADGFWVQLKMNFAAGYHAFHDQHVEPTHEGTGMVQ